METGVTGAESKKRLLFNVEKSNSNVYSYWNEREEKSKRASAGTGKTFSCLRKTY